MAQAVGANRREEAHAWSIESQSRGAQLSLDPTSPVSSMRQIDDIYMIKDPSGRIIGSLSSQSPEYSSCYLT
jgi:hypothetical protein